MLALTLIQVVNRKFDSKVIKDDNKFATVHSDIKTCSLRGLEQQQKLQNFEIEMYALTEKDIYKNKKYDLLEMN